MTSLSDKKNFNMTWDEEQVLEYILEYKDSTIGWSPSIRDIMKHTEINSTKTVVDILRKLEEKGHITRLPKHPRYIAIVGETWIPPQDLMNYFETQSADQ